ncbi:hypothetical protein G6F56_013061 [Rhizopus delemar]|nr:hypothetical protein G6F56_013061 [Rhizopus delemar]
MPLCEVYQQKHNTSPSSTSSSFEILFSRLLDILLFTSAIVITAYTYITGTLPNPLPLVETPPPALHKNMITYKLEEEDLQKTKRAKAQAQEQKLTNRKKRHSSASLLENKVQLPRDKKRTQSLSCLSTSKQEEMFSRMEERLQTLIQQGEKALLSP